MKHKMACYFHCLHKVLRCLDGEDLKVYRDGYNRFGYCSLDLVHVGDVGCMEVEAPNYSDWCYYSCNLREEVQAMHDSLGVHFHFVGHVAEKACSEDSPCSSMVLKDPGDSSKVLDSHGPRMKDKNLD